MYWLHFLNALKGTKSSTIVNETLALKKYNGKPVTCSIQHNNAPWGESKISDNLNVLYAPLAVASAPNGLIEVTKEENTVANKIVTCTGTEGNPAGFEWSVEVRNEGSDAVRPNSEVLAQEGDNKTATYSVNVKVDNANLLVTCIVKNSAGQSSAATKFEIITAPRISGIDVLVGGAVKSNAAVELGEDRKETITLRCIKSPASAKVEWLKIVGGLEESVTDGVGANGDLTLNVTHENDRDAYKCKASVEGQAEIAESNQEPIFLAFPATAVVSEPVVYNGDEGKRITVVASGNPTHQGRLKLLSSFDDMKRW